LDDVKPHRATINEKLRAAAATVGKQGLTLVIENEFACNTATGRESAQTLAAIQSPSFGLNWDPGNAVMRGELDAYPAGWDALPKNRIYHCHCKNAVKNAAGKIEWAPVDKGFVNWASQFAALDHAGYRDSISLETHWHGGGTPEESTRISWTGMQKCLKEANNPLPKNIS
jgi:sugar phosphate isomerase/epimerase